MAEGAERRFGIIASLASLSGAVSSAMAARSLQGEEKGDAPRLDREWAPQGVHADNSGSPAPVYDRSAEEAAPRFGGLEEVGAAYVQAGESVPVVSVEDALVAEADKAIRAREYLRGAEYYAEAAKLAPERVDYVLMRGHCLEDAGDFHGAYHAYADALAAAPSGDGHIQLGHLFKITGNLNEAELAYQRGARLGEPAAALELERLGSVSAAQFRLSAAAGVNALTVELFFELACCDRDDAFNHAAIVAAGKSLAAAGASDIAKAFFEIAYLGDDAGAFRQEHYGIVQRYPIWPTIHLSELVRASAVRAAQPPLTARARLKKLVAATLATLAGC